MTGYTLRPIAEMEAMAHGAVKRAAAELGVESFGMQVLDLPEGFDRYPAHDHRDDGMEEVYVVLRGSAELEIDGERVTIDPERMLRVAPEARRRLVPGPGGARILAIGSTLGRAYERPESFRLGAVDPTAEHFAEAEARR